MPIWLFLILLRALQVSLGGQMQMGRCVCQARAGCEQKLSANMYSHVNQFIPTVSLSIIMGLWF